MPDPVDQVIFYCSNALPHRSDTLGVSGCILVVCLRYSLVIASACWLLHVHVGYYMCMLVITCACCIFKF
jgi:hypothetical protein